MMKNSPKIFAVIVTYNGLKWYDRCLGSLPESLRTIVIDNASTDNSVDYINQHFDDVELVSSADNLGFAKANNIGIRKALDAGADYVLLLNQDAWIEPNTISEMLSVFDSEPSAGIVAPMQLNGCGSSLDGRFTSFLSSEIISDLYFSRQKSVYSLPFINAACWLISSRCLRKVGGFDTLLFCHYGEDNNYCQRVLFHGFSINLATNCRFFHDREERKDSSMSSKLFSKDLQDRQIKTEFGNINIEIDLPKIIANKERSLYNPCVCLRRKKVEKIKKEIEILRLIQSSRSKNIRGGEIWL